MRGVTDARETYKVLDLALRIGEILLSSGAGAADVTATMLGVTTHLGLRNAEVDVTFTLLRMSYQADPDEMPVLLTRTITQRDLDYDDLTRTQELVDDVLQDRVDVTAARARVARINSTNHYLPRWATVLGSGVVGGGIALILGGGVLVTAVATVAGCLITVLMRALNKQRWPMFYQQIARRPAGDVAGPRHRVRRPAVRPEGRHLAGDHGEHRAAAVRDRLHGRDPGRAERLLHHRRSTDHRGAAGHGGVDRRCLGGLALAPTLGVSLMGVRPGGAGLSDAPLVPLVVAGAMVSACAFAFTCYAPLRALPAIAMSTLLGHLVFLAVQDPQASMPWAAACAAVTIGLVSYAIAGRVGVPPLVVVVPALVPMLPGLLIYK